MWPDRASRPTTPEPGSTGCRLSSSTLVCGARVNRGPAAGPSWSCTDPLAPVSDAPNESVTITLGSSSRMAFLTDGDRIAPPDPMTNSDDTSYDDGSVASASTIGLAI